MNTKVTVGHDLRNKRKPHVVRWYGEFDLHTGKQRRYSKSFRLKVEAQQFAAQKTVEFLEGGRRNKPKEVTLSGFCRDWFSARKPELSPATLEIYENTISRLKNYFGENCKLSEIVPQRVAMFIAEQKSLTIGHEGRELSDSTREQIKRNSKALFEIAIEWGLLTTNPFKTLKSKKIAVKRWHRVTAQEYHALLAVLDPRKKQPERLREKLAYAILYTTGIRCGEAFSLMWSDVDFDSGYLIVANREGTNKLPPFHVKDHEARRIPLPKHTIDLLARYHTEAPEGVPYILLSKERYEDRKNQMEHSTGVW